MEPGTWCDGSRRETPNKRLWYSVISFLRVLNKLFYNDEVTSEIVQYYNIGKVGTKSA